MGEKKPSKKEDSLLIGTSLETQPKSSKTNSSIEVTRKELRSAVQAIESLTDSRAVQKYRSAVEINSLGSVLQLRVSDGESETIAEVARKGRRKMKAQAPAKVLYKSINAFQDKKIFIDVNEDISEFQLLNLKGTRKLGMNNLEEDFPEQLNIGDELFSIEVDSFLLAEALSKVIRIAGNDVTRPILSTVALSSTHFLGKDYLLVIATDSHRLIEIPVPIKPSSNNQAIFIDKPFLWPLRSVKALAAELSRQSKDDPTSKTLIREFEGGAEIKFPNRTWRSLGVNGAYPDAEVIFKNARADNLLFFKKEEMVEALKALSAVSVGDAPVLLELNKNFKINIRYNVPGITSFEEKLEESTYQGETHNIAFNPEYLMETVQLLDGGSYDAEGHLEKNPEEHQDKIRARLPGNSNPIILYGANFTRIMLMPVRV